MTRSALPATDTVAFALCQRKTSELPKAPPYELDTLIVDMHGLLREICKLDHEYTERGCTKAYVYPRKPKRRGEPSPGLVVRFPAEPDGKRPKQYFNHDAEKTRALLQSIARFRAREELRKRTADLYRRQAALLDQMNELNSAAQALHSELREVLEGCRKRAESIETEQSGTLAARPRK